VRVGLPQGVQLIALVARQEIEEQRGLIESPRPCCRCSERVFALGENIAEQLLGARAVEKNVLVGRALIGVARRNGDALDPQAIGLVEKKQRRASGPRRRIRCN